MFKTLPYCGQQLWVPKHSTPGLWAHTGCFTKAPLGTNSVCSPLVSKNNQMPANQDSYWCSPFAECWSKKQNEWCKRQQQAIYHTQLQEQLYFTGKAKLSMLRLAWFNPLDCFLSLNTRASLQPGKGQKLWLAPKGTQRSQPSWVILECLCFSFTPQNTTGHKNLPFEEKSWEWGNSRLDWAARSQEAWVRQATLSKRFETF